jgi:hypothetical protein
MLPVTGAFVAIDRVRESFRRTEGRALGERLAFFAADRPSPGADRASVQIMILAERLLSRYFPQARMPKPSDLLLCEPKPKT